MSNIRRVVVAVSGGVDSAVASLLLKQKGYDVVGVFMENFDSTNKTGICSVAKDAEDAHWVCSKLDIPFHHVSFVKEYWQEALSNVLKEYERGYTPNPDILCNQKIIHDIFYKYAQDKMDANAIATGHYARTTFGDFLENYDTVAGVHLLKPVDLFNDQTCRLSQVTQIPLQKTMFPLGSMTKPQVKRIACEFGMDYIAKKKEISGECFIDKKDLQKLISKHMIRIPGNFRDIDSGFIVGKHDGIHQWIIGQKCKIGSNQKHYYVSKKDPISNEILVAADINHPSLYTQFFFTMKPHWIHSIPQPLMQEGMFECELRLNYTQPFGNCFLMVTNDCQVLVKLVRPTRGVVKRQFASFYKGNECLGSAKITQLGPAAEPWTWEKMITSS